MTTAPEMMRRFNNVKTLPHVAIRLTQLISDPDSAIKEFVKLIRMDPTLVLRVLRLANSSYYGVKQKVEDIPRALVIIGMKNLRNMVVTEALKDIFESNSNEDIFSRSELWLHCAAVSICSQMISESLFGEKGEDAFLCGILHDIGMIVEDQVENDLFIQTCRAYQPGPKPLTEYEKEIMGTNHCELGYLLAQEWKLSVDIQEGIKHHHTSLKTVDPAEIKGIVQMAEYFITKLNYTAIPGMTPRLSPPLVAHIKSNLLEYKTLIKHLPDEISKAKEIYESQEE
jgi:HD-like signal output (HDOD) protein